MSFVAGFVCFIFYVFNTLAIAILVAAPAFAFGNHPSLPEVSDRAVNQGAYSSPGHTDEAHDPDLANQRESPDPGHNDWFRDGHMTEAESIDVPQEFYSTESGGYRLSAGPARRMDTGAQPIPMSAEQPLPSVTTRWVEVRLRTQGDESIQC